MTNRSCGGILLILALSCSYFTAPVWADKNIEVRKAQAVEPSTPAAPKDRVANPAEAEQPECFDLPRELAGKLVRVTDGKFEPARLSAERPADYLLVYFGAHWCPNCKKVTPRLTEFYREQRSEHRNFEVIFVSADKDEQAMLEFMDGYKMPWLAVKFTEKKSIDCLTKLAGRSYPCLALLDADGNLLAHSYGEDRKGMYIEPTKTLEKFKEILDEEKPMPVTKRVARSEN